MSVINLNEIVNESVVLASLYRKQHRNFEHDITQVCADLCEELSAKYHPMVNSYFESKLKAFKSIEAALKSASADFDDIPDECLSIIKQYTGAALTEDMGYDDIPLNLPMIFACWAFETQLLKDNTLELYNCSTGLGTRYEFQGCHASGLKTVIDCNFNMNDKLMNIEITSHDDNPLIIQEQRYSICRTPPVNDVKPYSSTVITSVILDENNTNSVNTINDLLKYKSAYIDLEHLTFLVPMMESLANGNHIAKKDIQAVTSLINRIDDDMYPAIAQMINTNPRLQDDAVLINAVEILLIKMKVKSKPISVAFNNVLLTKLNELARDEFHQLDFINMIEASLGSHLAKMVVDDPMHPLSTIVASTKDIRDDIALSKLISSEMDVMVDSLFISQDFNSTELNSLDDKQLTVHNHL